MNQAEQLRVRADDLRRRRLAKARSSSWFLATAILGRGWNPDAGGKDSPYKGRGLTEELHRLLCEWHDRNRNEPATGLFLSRFYHKTELNIVWMIQDILRDPCIRIGYFHGVDMLASQVVAEVGHHLQFCRELRKLEPIGIDEKGEPYNVLPGEKVKKFVTADQLTVKRHRHSRFPTLFGKGVNSEMTGLHMDIAYPDDIIGRNTIQDSQLGNVASWYQNTLVPVVDGGRFRPTGTLWDIEAIYLEWIASSHWKTVVLPCATDEEHDFISKPDLVDWTADKIAVPYDPKLFAPLYGPLSYRAESRKKLVWYQREMKHDFMPQMANDPSPAGEKPWNPKECEHYITGKEAGGAGLVVVLGDPAPAKVGSLSAERKVVGKEIYASEKDDWTWAVVKLRRRGQRNEIILLQLSGSKLWDLDEGFHEGCRLQKVWHARRHAVEKTGQAIALYDETHRRIAREEQVAHSPVDLTMTYQGKNAQFAALCSRARADEFLICETVDKKHLDKFLHQARNWRPMKQATGSKNGLPFDDYANVVSFACDPAFAPMVPLVDDDMNAEWSPFKKYESQRPSIGSRYIHIR